MGSLHYSIRASYSYILVISGIVSKSHTIRKCLITVEEVDLLEIMQPYLIVKGFPPFVNDEMLTQLFKAAADETEVESVQLRGSEATVFYVDPKGQFWYSFM